MYETDNVLRYLGIDLQDRPASYNYKSLQGKKCYGTTLESAVFGRDELLKTAGNAPVAATVSPQDIFPGKWADGLVLVQSNGTFVKSVTERFQLHQHGDLLESMVHGLEVLGLQKVASNVRYEKYGSRMVADVFLPARFGAVNVLADYTGNSILNGYRVVNAHDGSSSLVLQASSIDAICCNRNLWGADKWSVKISHADAAGADKWAAAISKMMKELQRLPEYVQAAQETMVSIKDKERLGEVYNVYGVPTAYAVGGKRGHAKTIPTISEQPYVYEPRIAQNAETASVWDLYSAGTALMTHAANVAPRAAEMALGKLSMMVDAPDKVARLLN